MCHIILVLPIVALPIFWLTPLPFASAAYTVVVGFSAWVYYRLMRGLHQPVITGQEGLLHATGEVVRGEDRHILVRILGEIWQAQSNELLIPGDSVEVTGVQGLQLSVRRRPR